MKETFAAEIEDENAKLEEYRQLAAPAQASADVAPRASVGPGVGASGRSTGKGTSGSPAQAKRGAGGANGTKRGDGAAARNANGPSTEMGWDDEELDTQIFDKDPESLDEKLQADDLFFEDEDRTVANEPPPDVLEQARAPELLTTPKPITLSTPEPSEDIKLTPAPAARPAGPPPGRKATLVGVPRVSLPGVPGVPGSLHSTPAPIPPPAAPSLRRSSQSLRRLGLNFPPPTLTGASEAPNGPANGPSSGPAQTGPGAFPFQGPNDAPFGSGSFTTGASGGRRSRSGFGVALALLVLVGGGGGYFAWHASTTRPGRIELVTTPEDAVVLIDNVKVGGHSPLMLERPPGPYTLSVTRDGYVRNDQSVELRPGQPLPLTVALAPSPDTGFELTSDPPGGLVWFDGAPIGGANGQQARTNFRAYRIAPGKHVLEIKGEARFRPWREEVQIQPGVIQQIHAALGPANGPAPAAKPSAASGTVASHPSPEPSAEPPSGSGASPSSAEGSHRAAKTTAGSESPPSGSPSSGTTAASTSGSVSASSGRERRRRQRESDDGAGSEDSSAKVVEGGDCSITVNSVPWSEVWIDGKNTTKHTPFVDFKLPCGKHKLAFKRPDMQIDHSESITVRSGQPFKQRYTLETE